VTNARYFEIGVDCLEIISALLALLVAAYVSVWIGLLHELVRQLLSHKNLKTTTNYYAGINTLRAGRAHSDLLVRLRTEITIQVDALYKAARIMLPDSDLRWLRSIKARLHSAAPLQRPTGPVITSLQILQLGLILMMYMTYGEAVNSDEMSARRYLPEGLVQGCRLKRAIATDAVIAYDDVVLPAGRLADRLRAEQYRKFRGETWLEELLTAPVVPEQAQVEALSVAG
jgi:hypothetical protein